MQQVEEKAKSSAALQRIMRRFEHMQQDDPRPEPYLPPQRAKRRILVCCAIVSFIGFVILGGLASSLEMHYARACPHAADPWTGNTLRYELHGGEMFLTPRQYLRLVGSRFLSFAGFLAMLGCGSELNRAK
jgi:hypothetical protein